MRPGDLQPRVQRHGRVGIELVILAIGRRRNVLPRKDRRIERALLQKELLVRRRLVAEPVVAGRSISEPDSGSRIAQTGQRLIPDLP